MSNPGKARIDIDYQFRDANDSDLALVRDSWRRSYEGTRYAWAPTLRDYIACQRQVIEQCLATSRVTVAYWPEEPDEILGWACYRGPVVHYVYVIGEIRRKGIGRALWSLAAREAAEKVWVTHQTQDLRYVQGDRQTVFCPAMMFTAEAK